MRCSWVSSRISLCELKECEKTSRAHSGRLYGATGKLRPGWCRWGGTVLGSAERTEQRAAASPALRLRCLHPASRGRSPRGTAGNTALPMGTARALCPGVALQPGRAELSHRRSRLKGLTPAQPDLRALLRSVADLFLLIFKYQVYLVYLLLLISVRIKNQRGYSSNDLFLKSDKLIPLDVAEARKDVFVPRTDCSRWTIKTPPVINRRNGSLFPRAPQGPGALFPGPGLPQLTKAEECTQVSSWLHTMRCLPQSYEHPWPPASIFLCSCELWTKPSVVCLHC